LFPGIAVTVALLATVRSKPISLGRKGSGISRSYAYLIANTGELPTVRLGRRILVPVASLRDLAGLDR
jgi:hypothetical protein